MHVILDPDVNYVVLVLWCNAKVLYGKEFLLLFDEVLQIISTNNTLSSVLHKVTALKMFIFFVLV